jgi:hypothetical protein
MEAIRLERRQHRRNALTPLGIPADRTRSFVSEVQAAGLEAEILSLPFFTASVEESGQQVLQDPATGAPYFMVGISPISGGDAVGG